MKPCKDFASWMERKIVIDAIKFVVLWLFGGWKIFINLLLLLQGLVTIDV